MWVALNAFIYAHGLFIFNSFENFEVFIIDSNSKTGTIDLSFADCGK